MARPYRERTAEQWERQANQQGGEFESFLRDDCRLYKPKKGSNAIRILPPTFDDAESYGLTCYVHYGVGPNNASVLCLQNMKGTRCPICDVRTRALKLGDDDEARQLRAGRRTLVWLIDRNDEDKGPMIWPMPYTVDKDFATLAKDKRTGEVYALDHPQRGYDLFFEKTGEGLTTKYEGKQIDRRPSSIEEKWQDYTEERPLPSCLFWRTFEEVKTLFEGGAEVPTRAAPKDAEPRRRSAEPNGHTNGTPRGRAYTEDETEEPPEPREPTRRRVAPAQEPPRTRREEINEEVPWEDSKTPGNGRMMIDEEMPPPMTAAERIKAKHRSQ